MIDDMLRDPSVCKEGSHPTIFGRFLNHDSSKGQALLPRETLIQEAMGFIMAGSIELSTALAYGTFHVLNDPEVHQRLVEELVAVCPDPNDAVGFEILERLPYLVGSRRWLYSGYLHALLDRRCQREPASDPRGGIWPSPDCPPRRRKAGRRSHSGRGIYATTPESVHDTPLLIFRIDHRIDKRNLLPPRRVCISR